MPPKRSKPTKRVGQKEFKAGVRSTSRAGKRSGRRTSNSSKVTSTPRSVKSGRANTVSMQMDAQANGGKPQGVRLQRVLAESGVCSRRKAEELIVQGRVTVNGQVVNVLGTRVMPDATILVDGKKLRKEQKMLFRFYKPRGVVTTMSDPHGRPSIADFTAKLPVRVFPIGRLDFDVSGVLLLTNDGELMEQLLHPRYETERVYIARIKAALTDPRRRLLQKGVELEDGVARVVRARSLMGDETVRSLLGDRTTSGHYAEIVVQEGKNHLVKRLLAAVGCDVERLSRVRFGEHTIKGLKPGDIREITGRSKLATGGQRKSAGRNSRSTASSRGARNALNGRGGAEKPERGLGRRASRGLTVRGETRKSALKKGSSKSRNSKTIARSAPTFSRKATGSAKRPSKRTDRR